VLSLLKGRTRVPFVLIFAARPLGALADALAARLRPNQFHREAIELIEDALDPAMMLAHLPEVLPGNGLQPYTTRSHLPGCSIKRRAKRDQGTLRMRAVFDGERRLIGWYLYYVQEGGVSEVVQVAARDGSFERVLERLLADAWRHGAVAVRGRFDPRHVQELSDRHCWLRREGHGRWCIRTMPKSRPRSSKGTLSSVAWRASGGCGSPTDKAARSQSQI